MENVNKQLLDWLKRLLECYKMADHRNGYCCCGSPMDRHDDPMNCGHSATDAGEYNASLIIEDVESTISAAEQAQQAEQQSEEAAYIKWMCETFPTVYDPPLARLWIEQKHVSFLAWMERAKQPSLQPPAVAAPGSLVDELEQCSMVMTYLGAADAEDIDSDTFEILGEDEQGREAYADVSIVEWAGRTAKLLSALAAAPQAAIAAPLPPYDTFSNDDGDSWQDCPDDAKFVNGRQLGEEFELLAGWQAERVTFRVTKVPDDESDDYEVEEVTEPATAQKGGA